MNEKLIYLDNAATSPVRKEVYDAMQPYFCELFGNASSQHAAGRVVMSAVDDARESVAKVLGCKSSEIYFTSGGTESDIWALRGIAYAHKEKGKHIITSAIEHPAVLNNCKQLEAEGFLVSYIGVDENGIIKLDELKKAINKETILISVMTANNEIGSIQPIEEIGQIAKMNKIVFHTDAVQAIGAVKFDVKAMNIDLLSLSAHKFGGPKGIGVLYIRNGLKIAKHQIGGHQERSMRSGTHNTPGIVGLGKAIELAELERGKNNEKLESCCSYFMQRVENEIDDIKFNGSKTSRLKGVVNYSFKYIEGEALLLRLDLKGICVSSGSACSSGSLEPSHVLLAIGVPVGLAHGSIRFSFGKDVTKEQVDYVVDSLKEVVATLREMSPLC